jgi:hypothetical protein
MHHVVFPKLPYQAELMHFSGCKRPGFPPCAQNSCVISLSSNQSGKITSLPASLTAPPTTSSASWHHPRSLQRPEAYRCHNHTNNFCALYGHPLDKTGGRVSKVVSIHFSIIATITTTPKNDHIAVSKASRQFHIGSGSSRDYRIS